MSRAKKLLVAVIVCLCSLVALARADNTPHPLQQPKVQTPLTRTELMSALRAGHVRAFGEEASRNRLAMAWGQVAFENGHGRLTFNHNLGNVMAGPGQPVYYNPGDHHFYRSFRSAVDGAEAYWAVIKHCAAALVHFDDGNAAAAVHALKRCNYFEAPESVYAPIFISLYQYAQTHLFTKEDNEQRERFQQQLQELAASARSPGVDSGGH